MRFCEYINCNQPVFGQDKITRIGYCKRHQFARTDLSKLSITQKAVAKHKEQQKTKQRKPGWFDVERIEVTERNGELVDIVETDRIITNNGKSGELWRWFKRQRNFMTGKCAHCGGKTQKDDDNTFHYSIAHLLPKNFFKSISTNDNNWIELCYYGKSCHTNFDHHMIDITELNCFSQVIDKFVAMYPFIDKSERRRIPEVLLQYLEVEK